MTTVHTVKSKGKISQNFVAFSEYMNSNMLLKFPDLYHPRKIHDEWSVDKSSTHLCGRQAKNGFCEWLAYMMDNGFKSILKQNSYFELLPALSQDTH